MTYLYTPSSLTGREWVMDELEAEVDKSPYSSAEDKEKFFELFNMFDPKNDNSTAESLTFVLQAVRMNSACIPIMINGGLETVIQLMKVSGFGLDCSRA